MSRTSALCRLPARCHPRRADLHNPPARGAIRFRYCAHTLPLGANIASPGGRGRKRMQMSSRVRLVPHRQGAAPGDGGRPRRLGGACARRRRDPRLKMHCVRLSAQAKLPLRSQPTSQLARSGRSSTPRSDLGKVSIAKKADVEISAKGRFSRGGDSVSPGMLALLDDRFGRGVFGPDTYRFCKLISDTSKTAIGCGSGARVGPGTTGRRMLANATRFLAG
jgi:hypothetical protein